MSVGDFPVFHQRIFSPEVFRPHILSLESSPVGKSALHFESPKHVFNNSISKDVVSEEGSQLTHHNLKASLLEPHSTPPDPELPRDIPECMDPPSSNSTASPQSYCSNEILASLSSSQSIVPPHLKKRKSNKPHEGRKIAKLRWDSSKSNRICFREELDDSGKAGAITGNANKSPNHDAMFENHNSSKPFINDSKSGSNFGFSNPVQKDVLPEIVTCSTNTSNLGIQNIPDISLGNSQPEPPVIKSKPDYLSDRVVTNNMVSALLKSTICKLIYSGDIKICMQPSSSEARASEVTPPKFGPEEIKSSLLPDITKNTENSSSVPPNIEPSSNINSVCNNNNSTLNSRPLETNLSTTVTSSFNSVSPIMNSFIISNPTSIVNSQIPSKNDSNAACVPANNSQIENIKNKPNAPSNHPELPVLSNLSNTGKSVGGVNEKVNPLVPLNEKAKVNVEKNDKASSNLLNFNFNSSVNTSTPSGIGKSSTSPSGLQTLSAKSNNVSEIPQFNFGMPVVSAPSSSSSPPQQKSTSQNSVVFALPVSMSTSQPSFALPALSANPPPSDISISSRSVLPQTPFGGIKMNSISTTATSLFGSSLPVTTTATLTSPSLTAASSAPQHAFGLSTFGSSSVPSFGIANTGSQNQPKAQQTIHTVVTFPTQNQEPASQFGQTPGFMGFGSAQTQGNFGSPQNTNTFGSTVNMNNSQSLFGRPNTTVENLGTSVVSTDASKLFSSTVTKPAETTFSVSSFPQNFGINFGSSPRPPLTSINQTFSPSQPPSQSFSLSTNIDQNSSAITKFAGPPSSGINNGQLSFGTSAPASTTFGSGSPQVPNFSSNLSTPTTSPTFNFSASREQSSNFVFGASANNSTPFQFSQQSAPSMFPTASPLFPTAPTFQFNATAPTPKAVSGQPMFSIGSGSSTTTRSGRRDRRRR